MKSLDRFVRNEGVLRRAGVEKKLMRSQINEMRKHCRKEEQEEKDKLHGRRLFDHRNKSENELIYSLNLMNLYNHL